MTDQSAPRTLRLIREVIFGTPKQGARSLEFAHTKRVARRSRHRLGLLPRGQTVAGGAASGTTNVSGSALIMEEPGAIDTPTILRHL